MFSDPFWPSFRPFVGSSKVLLGFVSLTENLMMVGMALWMLLGAS
jgi:hypothetical protein